MTKNKRLVVLELNELNLHFVQRYVELGRLPNFARTIEHFGLVETSAEDEYSDLEPWIQWVTVHTGKTLEEHGIFRLGDAPTTDLEQVWEILEEKFGVSVGAVSPMNAADRTKAAKFFVPDPWSDNETTGARSLKMLSEAATQAVNDNSAGVLTPASALKLAAGASVNLRPSSLRTLAGLARQAKSRPWTKAMLFDRLLSDVFLTQWGRHQPDFSSLFLNAGAHIQHHYTYNSPVYSGSLENPEWYVPSDEDPVGACYELYDQILGDIVSFCEKNDTRLMIVTGLSQVPNPKIIHYYRPRDHAAFMGHLGVQATSVEPRMSRDFLLTFDSDADAAAAAATLSGFDSSGRPLFRVDNRGTSLFCQLAITDEISDSDVIDGPDGSKGSLLPHVVHVSIENSIHQTTGYYLDSDGAEDTPDRIELTSVFGQIVDHFQRQAATATAAA